MSNSFPKEFETTLEVYKTKSILGEGGSGRVFLTKPTFRTLKSGFFEFIVPLDWYNGDIFDDFLPLIESDGG